jgi:hypothetical protein
MRPYLDLFQFGLFNAGKNTPSDFGGVFWYRLRPDGTSGWAYQDHNGVVRYLTDGEENIREDAWSYLRLVLDYKNKRYDRIQTNLIDLDLSSYPLYPWVAWSECFLVSVAAAINSAAVLPYPIYIDDVRVYLNEA